MNTRGKKNMLHEYFYSMYMINQQAVDQNRHNTDPHICNWIH